MKKNSPNKLGSLQKRYLAVLLLRLNIYKVPTLFLKILIRKQIQVDLLQLATVSATMATVSAALERFSALFIFYHAPDNQKHNG